MICDLPAEHRSGKVIASAGEQSSVPNIYAIGDVIHGKLELTPVAIQAGKLLANRLYSDAKELVCKILLCVHHHTVSIVWEV